MSKFLSDRFAGLEEYVPGEQPKDMKYIKLNTNESPYPPSPSVRAAVEGQVDSLRLYPDPDGSELRESLAGFYGVNPENVFLSNGSDEILFFYFTAFCDQTRPVVFPNITYGFYPVYARLLGIPYTEIPLCSDFTVNSADYTGIHKNIVLANPNAPTGLEISLDSIEKILATNPEHVVLIDEAYIDFGGSTCIGLCQQYKNLLVARTYSKSRSMAGARLGFAIGDEELIKDLNKIKYSVNPYNVNRMTLAAGKAAICDSAYYTDCCSKIIECREDAAAQLRALGYSVTDSHANFLFARSPKRKGEELYRELKKMGILVRHFNKEPISDWLRITVGTREEMKALIDAVKKLEGVQ